MAAFATAITMQVPVARAQLPPTVEPRAFDILTDLCGYLRELQSYRFQADVLYDEVLPSGQKIQYQKQQTVVVRRPDRLHLAQRGDIRDLLIYYDGKAVSLLDVGKNVYTSVLVPPTIDAALDHLAKRYDLIFELEDLVFNRPCPGIEEDITTGFYVGLRTVDGVPAHHLAFQSEAADVQLWVQEGDEPLLLKLAIDYVNLPAIPRYSATLSGWEVFSEPPDDAGFIFNPPPKADEIELVPVVDANDDDVEADAP